LSKNILFNNSIRESSAIKSLNMRLRMQFRSATVKKMAGIFTKLIWQPYLVMKDNWSQKHCEVLALTWF